MMVFLAGLGPERSATKQQIAAAEGISALYAEQILLKLRHGGMVTSRRGPGGGFTMLKAPSAVTVGDILRVADGPISLAPCEKEPCRRLSECVTRGVWERATRALEKVFDSTTVESLAMEARQHTASGAYHI
jgi:Rrf2 family iron-sulfur cluster assembly transcriptional regulator